MNRLHFAAVCGLTLLFSSPLLGDEYGRYAQGSVSIPDGGENGRNFDIGGLEIEILDLDGDSIPASYGLAPFQFHPRDFSLTQVDSINGVTLSLTNELSVLADNGGVEVFYVPDSRADLGVAVDEETADCGWNAPQACYNVFYNADEPGGIDPVDFSAAPVSLGSFEMDFSESEWLTNTFDLDVPSAVATSMAERINAGEGFHLAFAATDSEGFLEIGSFNGGFDGEPGAAIRPELVIDASGVAGGVTKDLIRQGAIHGGGDTSGSDFYGSGNDDDFSEFGIAGFQFTKNDFGAADDITELGSVQLTLHHNDRSFADGDLVEFFLVSDTADELGFDEFLGYLGKTDDGELVPLTYDASIDNGINEDQFVNPLVSLGTHEYTPKFGGVPDTFDLELSADAEEQLLASINAGDDFQIVIGTTDSTFDITFSGLDNAFDPGNPQLTINLDGGATTPEFDLDVNDDGAVNADDSALLCSAISAAGLSVATEIANGGLLNGDADLNGSVEFADFLLLSGSFGGEGHYGDGDFDCNGRVEFADFLVLSGNFGQSVRAEAASVPEPTGLAMIIAALGGLSIVRRRR